MCLQDTLTVSFSTIGQALPMRAHENLNFDNYSPLLHIIAEALVLYAAFQPLTSALSLPVSYLMDK